MELLLVTLGTAGDVHPFVALGSELKRRNHRVVLVTNEHFRPVAERVGLDFQGIGSADHYRCVLANPDIWRPVRGFRILIQELILGSMRAVFDAIERLGNERTVLVAPCFIYGARIAREKFSIPLATLVLQPASVWSTVEPSLTASVPWSSYLPRSLQSLFARGLEHFFLEPLLAPETNRFRRELGFSPVQRILAAWQYSPDRVIGLFPEWFAPHASDWPSQLIQTGFISHENLDPLPMPRELENFLSRGEAPIVFTPGSGNCHASKFFEVAAAACRKLQQRGLFLTGYANQLPKNLPDGVRHFEYAPFDKTFPSCKALVHHGGIGTLAKGLAAGLPQLIMPMAFDQPDNARRLKRLGAGDLILPKHFTPDRVADKLGRMIRSDDLNQRCRTLSSRIDTGAALNGTCSIIESLPRVES